MRTAHRMLAVTSLALASLPSAGCGSDGAAPSSEAQESEASQALSSVESTLVGIGGKCLGDAGDSGADRNAVVLATCNGSKEQMWSLTGGKLLGPGGKCLDIAGDQQTNNTRVQLYTCNGTSAQTWASSAGQLHSSKGLCLNVKNGSSADGTAVELYECISGASSEVWTVTPVGTTTMDAGAPAHDAGTPIATPDGGSSPPAGGECAGASSAVDGSEDAAHVSGKAPPTCTPSGFTIAYIDDFTGSKLASGWTLPSNFQYNASWVSSSLVTVHDGMLDIGEEYSGKAGDEAVVGWAQLTNDPAALLKNGKFLVRQRADVQTNVAVATLTWPVPKNVWPPEIDFAEDDVGDRHWYAFNHYIDATGKNAQTWEDSGLTSSDWHTWGIEWTPSSIVYTRDGAVWKTETDKDVIPTIQMYLGFVMACFHTPPEGSSHWQMDWVALYSMS